MSNKKKKSESELGSVSLALLETDRGVWACYADSVLVAWGGSEMTAKELLSILQNRAISSWRCLDMGDYAPEEFPRSLDDVPGVNS